MTRKERIRRAFGRAAGAYADHAVVQRMAAEHLADRIAALPLRARPRVLEIGCGAGFLTRALAARLPAAELTVSDFSAEMVAACRTETGVEAAYMVMDGERPALAEGAFDLVCAGLAVQWFEHAGPSLGKLCGLLRPGGWLAFSTLLSGTFAEWRGAHESLDLTPGLGDFAAPEDLQHFSWRGADLLLDEERIVERHADGADFLAALKAIGANVSAAGHTPLSPAKLKQVLAAFEEAGACATYHLGYGLLRRPNAARGVFVVGTDTDVGKTVVSACLVLTLGADYWKPVQTGTAVDPGDTATVARLAALAPDRLHASVHALPEPLSPHAAAELAGVEIRLEDFQLPETERPLVVEGAGGVFVPLNADALMLDLIARLGLPVVVVARSTLGTINHTLLTLAALRERAIPVLGVVMNGPPSASNREAIERYGRVSVLAEVPRTDDLTPEWVAQAARTLSLAL